MDKQAETGSIIEMWTANCAITEMLLFGLSEEGLEAVPLLKAGKPGRGRNVARVFIHMHNVRLYHLDALAKTKASGLTKFGKGVSATRTEIKSALGDSSDAVAEYVCRALAEGKLIHKRHPALLLGYLVSHESHHRGQIMLALKQNGIKVHDDLKWGLWSKWFKD